MKNKGNKITILVDGMTCSNCALGIKKHLISKGLKNPEVSFSTSEVSYNSDKYSENQVKNFIKNLGYTIIEKDNKIKYSLQEKLFLFSSIFTFPLLLHMFLPHGSILHEPIVQFTICTPVFVCGFIFFGKSALKSIKSATLNMDVLITLGSTAAYIYSTYGCFF